MIIMIMMSMMMMMMMMIVFQSEEGQHWRGCELAKRVGERGVFQNSAEERSCCFLEEGR